MPRQSNGLVPEEPDTAEDLLDAVALQILDDEYESIVAKEKLGLIDKKSKKGNFMKQILGVFQDASDDRFARKLSVQRAEQERKQKEEEVDLEVDEAAVKDPGVAFLHGAGRIKADASQVEASASLEERIEKTKTAAQRLGSAVHFFDTTINSELVGDTEPSSAPKGEKEGGGEGEEKKVQSRSTIIDAEKIDKFKVELPVHVDRPPSPIVFARSLQPITIAQDVPDILLVTEHRQRAAMSPTASKSLHSYAKAAVDEIWKHDDDSSSSSSDSGSDSDSSRSPIGGGRRTARKSQSPTVGRQTARTSRSPTAGRRTARTSRSPTAGHPKARTPRETLVKAAKEANARRGAPAHRGRKVTTPRKKRNESKVSDGIFNAPSHTQGANNAKGGSTESPVKKHHRHHHHHHHHKNKKRGHHHRGHHHHHDASPNEKVRYGAWYINPEKWTVGMYNVLNEMAAKQQGSWGVEMASIKAKADDLQREIPRLFIGKAFTKDLVGKGCRLPHFLSRVVLEDDGNLQWLRSMAENSPKPEGRAVQRGGTFVALKPEKPAVTATPTRRGRRTMTILKKRDPD
jgi:hypothetical protein